MVVLNVHREQHANRLLQNLSELLRVTPALADVTLACKEGALKAHRAILAACSPYFRELLDTFRVPGQHPVLVLQQANFRQIQALLDFVYFGEVNLDQIDLQGFLELATFLQIADFSIGSRQEKPVASEPGPPSYGREQQATSTYRQEVGATVATSSANCDLHQHSAAFLTDARNVYSNLDALVAGLNASELESFSSSSQPLETFLCTQQEVEIQQQQQHLEQDEESDGECADEPPLTPSPQDETCHSESIDNKKSTIRVSGLRGADKMKEHNSESGEKKGGSQEVSWNQKFSSHKREFYVCEHCGEMFSNKFKIERHLLSEHLVTKDLKVYKKFKKVSSKKKKRALKKKSVKKSRSIFATTQTPRQLNTKRFQNLAKRADFICRFCFMPSYNLQTYKYHMEKFHRMSVLGTRLYGCHRCPKEVTYPRHLHDHYHKFHPGEQILMQCPLCTELFTGGNLLHREHLAIHFQSKDSPCDVCSRVFANALVLAIHKSQNHPPPLSRSIKYEEYTCDLCQQIFTKKTVLRSHIIYTHGSKDSYYCTKCNKVFCTYSELLNHWKEAHTPLSCLLCNKVFVSKRLLLIHMMKGHKDRRQPYSCLQCHKSYSRMDRLFDHEDKVHGARSNRWACSFCGEIFDLDDDMTAHLYAHDAEDRKQKIVLESKRVKSNITPSALFPFKSYQDLLRGMSVRESDQISYDALLMNSPKMRNGKYRCELCLKCFATTGGRSKHIKRAHKLKYDRANHKYVGNYFVHHIMSSSRLLSRWEFD